MKRTFRSFSDRHTHLREGDLLKTVVPMNNLYHNVLAMPNLSDSVDDTFKLEMYRGAILKNSPRFIPTLGLMLTRNTTPATIRKAYNNGASFLKWIPAAASTHSNNGVAIDDIEQFSACLCELERLGMPFLVHLERAEWPKSFTIIDIEREVKAITTAQWLVEHFPKLMIVFEHASTKELIRLVEQSPYNVIATLTVHHALKCYEDAYDQFHAVKNVFLFCRPSLKRKDDMLAVRKAMTSGDYKKFRFGSDNAPHLRETKLAGIPGIFMPAMIAIPLLCQIFEEENALDKLEGFACTNSTDVKFYGWDYPDDSTFTLIDEEWIIPETINGIVPFMAGEKLRYRILPQ